MPATPVWLAAVEALMDRGIKGSTRAASLVKRLEGTSLQVDVEGIATIRAGVANGRLALTADPGTSLDSQSVDPVNATVSGSPLALFNLARGGASRVSAAAAAQVRGDAEIANSYQQLFTVAAPDLEEELSRVIGDFPARQVSQFARQTVGWMRRARRTAGENLAEYLQEEGRDLVNRFELDEFLQGVDALRETTDRMEARLARLELRLKHDA